MCIQSGDIITQQQTIQFDLSQGEHKPGLEQQSHFVTAGQPITHEMTVKPVCEVPVPTIRMELLNECLDVGKCSLQARYSLWPRTAGCRCQKVVCSSAVPLCRQLESK